MANYLDLDLIIDQVDLEAVAHDSLIESVPGYVPAEGSLEARFIGAIGRMASVLYILIGQVPKAIFRYFGTEILELESIEASRATGTSTWTMINNAGWTIAAGTNVGIRTAGDELVGFTVVDDVIVPPGSTVTAAGAVALIATDEGAAASGLTANPELIDSLVYVVSIALTGTTVGGVDAETDDDYLNRLVEELRLLSPTPILPQDYAVLAKRVPGVARALALNLLNPDNGTLNNPRYVTVAIVDATGEPASTATKTAVDDLLQGMREVNCIVRVIDPTYTTVDVIYTATAYADADPVDVEARADADVVAYLSPATWGQPTFGTGDAFEWQQTDKVRFLEVAGVLNVVEGLDHVDSLLIGKRRAVTGVALTDVFTAVAHGIIADQKVVFSALTGGTGLTVGTVYYARDITADTFKVAATVGGAAVDFSSDVTAGNVTGLGTADVAISGYAPLARSGSVDGTVAAP